ncbi:MAG TPA: porin [Gemmatimonadaceae bacterium]|nr:porin [Gemmatimonadaceae bacterium]
MTTPRRIAPWLFAAALLAFPCVAVGQADTARPTPRRAPWHERISIRGYTQVRYNRLLETNELLACPQCDRSIGRSGGFFIRRSRLVFSGDLHDRIAFYIQPDLASDAGTQLHFAQIRDAYVDVFLDARKELRVRLGQSKVPFGWENLQSSSVRLPLDRADALNSGVPNERDLGLAFYWAPRAVRQRLRTLVDSGYKGTGDYGVLGLAVYNGQTANRPELNDGSHVAARAAYPVALPGGQLLEIGVQGYTGRFVIPASQRTAGVIGPEEFDDWRAAASVVWFPRPIGFQAEWNVGRGPEVDPVARVIAERRLTGGYGQVMLRTGAGGISTIPYFRAQYYDGGKKLEQDGRRYLVREYEAGVEWLPVAALELTAAYVLADRRAEDAAAPQNRQKGQLLRLQAQFNY